VVFTLSRVAVAAAGVRFDLRAITTASGADQWQLLDTTLLRHDLLASVWYLHSQPPLYNLYCGLLVHLPLGAARVVAQTSFLAMGLVLGLGTFLLLVELGVPAAWAWALAALVMVDPAAMLYENWLFYAEPTAAGLVVTGWCLARFLRSGQRRWGVGAFGASAGVVLLNATFQAVWFLAVVGIALVSMRHRWRRVVASAALPALALGLWYGKDAAVFGTATTSSWLGMNLAKPALVRLPPGQLHQLVADGTLDALAQVKPFAPVAAYVPRFVPAPHTGIPALDRPTKHDGQPNYDDLAYVAVSRRYLRDDLAAIRARPGSYLKITVEAAGVWLVPAEQYGPLSGAQRPIAGYVRLYDRAVDWQVHSAPAAGFVALLGGFAPRISQLSLQALLVDALAVLAAPVLAWRRRSDAVAAGLILFAWLTTCYVVVVTTMVELGENNRFRFELGPLPLVVAAAVVCAAVRAAAARRGSRPSLPADGPDLRRRARVFVP